MSETLDYGDLISRHCVSRLRSFPPETVKTILKRCQLERIGETVRSTGHRALTDTDSYQYKQAIKEVLGTGAYEMTKVNFILAGCQCQDCRRGL